MIALETPLSIASPFERWHRHFIDNRERPAGLAWDDSYHLNAAELRAVAGSIQQFQLGEYARGRGLMRRAAADPILGKDSSFLPALELFIAEEQTHSAILGRFLDREGIPRLRSDWVDGAFRRLRKLAGLDTCASV